MISLAYCSEPREHWSETSASSFQNARGADRYVFDELMDRRADDWASTEAWPRGDQSVQQLCTGICRIMTVLRRVWHKREDCCHA